MPSTSSKVFSPASHQFEPNDCFRFNRSCWYFLQKYGTT